MVTGLATGSFQLPAGLTLAHKQDPFMSHKSPSTTASDVSDDELDGRCCQLSMTSLSDTEFSDVETLSAPPSPKCTTVTRQAYSITFLLQYRTAPGVCQEPETTLRAISLTDCGGEATIRTKQPPQGIKVSFGQSKSSTAPSPESWVAQQQRRRREAAAGKDVVMSSEQFARQVKSVLNKLTVERFELLFEKLASCGARTPQQVAVLVREIFEKATTQHSFISMYADLCGRLEADPRIADAAATGQTAQLDSFRQILLNQCQTSFEEMLTGSQEWGAECLDLEEAEEKRARCKQRALGNVKLIGRLLAGGFVCSKILLILLHELLESRFCCSDALECLATLLTIVGPVFDVADWSSQPELNDVFGDVQEFILDKAIPARTRFLLRDVIELRKAGWADKRAVTVQSAVPMKLDEVRRKATVTSAVVTKQEAKNVVVYERPKLKLMRKGEAAQASPKASRDLQQAELAKKVVPAILVGKLPNALAKPFDRASFHSELWSTLCQLSRDNDVGRATMRIDNQFVPVSDQAAEFVDLITRAVDEPRAKVRDVFFDLVASMAKNRQADGAFSQSSCLEGIESFFFEVFDDLCEEDPRVRAVVLDELMPRFRSTLPASQLAAVVPPNMR